ncbi:MAG TPA: hypothetical protein VGI76_10205 [Solirubrobacteraceae bacterium]
MVFAVVAAASATASADWMVGGTALVGSAPLSNALVLKEGELVVTGVTTLKCTAHEITVTNGSIVAPDKILASSLTFNGCKGSNAPCDTIAGEKVSTVPIHGVAKLDGTLNTYITVLPETKTVFATIAFTNAECPLIIGGGVPVSGTFSLLAHEGFDERLGHSVLVFSLTNALKVGSTNAEIKGVTFDIKLTSNKLWSFL